MRQICAVLLVVTVALPAWGFQKQPDANQPSQANVALVSPQDKGVIMAEPVGGMISVQKNVIYPEIARRAGIEGTVDVKAVVDEKGNVVETEVLKGVHPALDSSAVIAVSRTKFSPGTEKGKPIKVTVVVPVRYSLIGAPSKGSRAERHRIQIGSYPLVSGAVNVPDKAEWKAETVQGTETKVTLILEEKRGEWSFRPVQSLLDPDEALKLAAELQKAAEKAKKNTQ